MEELSSTEGLRQGDPFAALAFALTFQPLYEAATATIEPSGGQGVAIQHDLGAVATWREVLKVFDYVRAQAHESNVRLRVDECELYFPPDSARGHGCTERQEETRAACSDRFPSRSDRNHSASCTMTGRILNSIATHTIIGSYLALPTRIDCAHLHVGLMTVL